MSGITLNQALAGAVQMAQQVLDATVDDVDDALANAAAPGRANPIGTSYVHAICAEDGVVSHFMRGTQPRFMTDFKGRTGADKAMPMYGSVEGDLGEWYRTAKVDMAAARKYATAVAADAQKFISEADEATLNRMMDMSFAGLGEIPLASMFLGFVVAHINNLCGEISAVKGALGRKGYPF